MSWMSSPFTAAARCAALLTLLDRKMPRCRSWPPAFLADEPIVLDGVPDVTDVNTLALALGHRRRRNQTAARWQRAIAHRRSVGSHCQRGTRRSNAGQLLLARPALGAAWKSGDALPGGCRIGARPVDLHLQGLAALGANIRIQDNLVIAEAKSLHGVEMNLSGPARPDRHRHGQRADGRGAGAGRNHPPRCCPRAGDCRSGRIFDFARRADRRTRHLDFANPSASINSAAVLITSFPTAWKPARCCWPARSPAAT